MRYKALYPVLRWSQVPWFGWTGDYEPRLIEEIKGMPIRAWDPGSKTWWFPKDALPLVEAIIGATLERPSRPAVLRSASPYATLGVIEQAPRCVVIAAHRALTRQFAESGYPQQREELDQALGHIAQLRGWHDGHSSTESVP